MPLPLPFHNNIKTPILWWFVMSCPFMVIWGTTYYHCFTKIAILCLWRAPNFRMIFVGSNVNSFAVCAHLVEGTNLTGKEGHFGATSRFMVESKIEKNVPRKASAWIDTKYKLYIGNWIWYLMVVLSHLYLWKVTPAHVHIQLGRSHHLLQKVTPEVWNKRLSREKTFYRLPFVWSHLRQTGQTAWKSPC